MPSEWGRPDLWPSPPQSRERVLRSHLYQELARRNLPCCSNPEVVEGPGMAGRGRNWTVSVDCGTHPARLSGSMGITALSPYLRLLPGSFPSFVSKGLREAQPKREGGPRGCLETRTLGWSLQRCASRGREQHPGGGSSTSMQTSPCTECCFVFTCFFKDEITTLRETVVWKLGCVWG